MSAVLVDLIVYYTLSTLFNLNTDISKACGFLFGSVYTYYLNKKWTWKHTEKSNKGMIFRFAIIFLISFAFNVLINKYSLSLLPDFVFNAQLTYSTGEIFPIISLKGDKFLAFFFATVFSAVFNFLGQKFWVFKQVKFDPKDETKIEVY